jgi:hypothetical protein
MMPTETNYGGHFPVTRDLSGIMKIFRQDWLCQLGDFGSQVLTEAFWGVEWTYEGSGDPAVKIFVIFEF